MKSTLREVMQLRCLKNAKIITDNCDLDKEVEFVDVIEVPDFFNWIRPNTFLCTTAYAIKDDIEAQTGLISKLSKLGVTALSIKPRRFIGKISDAMIQQANEISFPIIELPNDALYSDIILGISGLILGREINDLQSILNIKDTFNELVLEGGSFDDIAENLSNILESPVLIEDNNFNILAHGDIIEGIPINNDIIVNLLFNQDRKELIMNNKDIHSPIVYKLNSSSETYVSFPIRMQDKCLGFITMIERDNNRDINITALEHAAYVAAIKLSRTNHSYHEKMFTRHQLVSKLLSKRNNQNNNIENEIVYFGWPINQKYVSVVLQPKMDEKLSLEIRKHKEIYTRKLAQILKNKFCSRGGEAIDYVDGENVLIFISLNNEEVKDYKKYTDLLVDIIIKKAQQFGFTPYIGVGIPVKNIYEIKFSYEKSIFALNMAKKIGSEKSIVYYDELDIYEIIMNYEPKSDLYDFCDRYIGPLIDNHESDKNIDLIRTLEVYLDSGCSLIKASKKLYIHRNTLIYRLNKIKEVMLYDLDDPRNHFKINFAIKIYGCLSKGKDI